MKIICIGDIHGRDCWVKILEQNPDADLFVFEGDYFDSFTIPALEQINNFKLILKFRDENPNKVIMLFGNHDFHYTKIPPKPISTDSSNAFYVTSLSKTMWRWMRCFT
jgi:predicted phosphodiesterase